MPSIQLAAANIDWISPVVRPAKDAADASAMARLEIVPATNARSSSWIISAWPRCSARSSATVVRRSNVPSRSNTTTGKYCVGVVTPSRADDRARPTAWRRQTAADGASPRTQAASPTRRGALQQGGALRAHPTGRNVDDTVYESGFTERGPGVQPVVAGASAVGCSPRAGRPAPLPVVRGRGGGGPHRTGSAATVHHPACAFASDAAARARARGADPPADAARRGVDRGGYGTAGQGARRHRGGRGRPRGRAPRGAARHARGRAAAGGAPGTLVRPGPGVRAALSGGRAARAARDDRAAPGSAAGRRDRWRDRHRAAPDPFADVHARARRAAVGVAALRSPARDEIAVRARRP